MSNRRKSLRERFRGRQDAHLNKYGIQALGKARNIRSNPLEELKGLPGFKEVTVPDVEVVVIKEVPAVVTHPQTGEKVTVGTAFIHDDRSVAIKYNEDAPEWALDYIKATEQEVGYSLETGGTS